MTTEPLLEVTDLDVHYRTSGGAVRAVSGASFALDENEYFGLVGESGSGKSTIAKAVIGGLDFNGEVVSGSIEYRGEEIQDYSEREYNENVRWKEISVIPQSAMNSLDPVMRISDQAIELAETHTDWSKTEALDQLRDLFDVVGLAESRIHDYPHQFSGGMKQRTVIALALFLEPSLIIADEPTTALDVIMQDQILKYIEKMKDGRDVSMIMITHDISVVFETCDVMAVMHGGQVAEKGTVDHLFEQPRHPYSILLQGAFPDIRYPKRELSVIEGEPPTTQEEMTYCSFADRCPWAQPACRDAAPPLEPMAEDDAHLTSCIRSEEITDLAEEYLRDHEEEHVTIQERLGSTGNGQGDDRE